VARAAVGIVAGGVIGGLLALGAVLAFERWFPRPIALDEADIARSWWSVDFPERCEPAWLRQFDITDGPDPW
jgi:hypothetical protein